MVKCFCRWRNLLLCVCASCTSLILTFLLTGYLLCLTLIQGQSTGTLFPVNNLFVASGVLQNASFAPLPKTFWDINFQNAFWNKLQLTIDDNFNPILNINASRKPRDMSFDDLLINQSFFKIRDSESMRKNFEELPEQMQQFVLHMQRRDYPLLLQPRGVCGAHVKDEQEPPLLLFAIKTSEMNMKNRIAIRKTWGQVGWAVGWSNGNEEVGGYIRLVFLLGKGNSESMDLSSLLRMESDYYGDMLQWDFQDTFFNLTLKDVLFWDWFSKSCKQIAFVFKGDDDIFVNTPKMVAYLQEQRIKLQATNTMDEFVVGDVIESAMPSRSNNSKYFIPEGFYKGLYPRYAGGGGVIYSGQLIKRLHHMSKRVHLFPIDDVYVGMCILRLNASPVHHPAFLTFDFKEKESLCSYHTILLVHRRSPSEVVKLWDELKRTRTKCQHVPLMGEQNMIETTKAIPAFVKSQFVVEELFL